MERREAVRALEDELLSILSLAERANCMAEDVLRELFVFRPPKLDEEFRHAFASAEIKTAVAREALDAMQTSLHAMLSAQ